jgi:hypothetical protein
MIGLVDVSRWARRAVFHAHRWLSTTANRAQPKLMLMLWNSSARI